MDLLTKYSDSVIDIYIETNIDIVIDIYKETNIDILIYGQTELYRITEPKKYHFTSFSRFSFNVEPKFSIKNQGSTMIVAF